MFLKINQKLLAILLVCALSFTSCNKEDEKPALPEVSFQNIQEDMKVRGSINLDLSASDVSRISKVEIYINNILVATLTEAPFTINWMTKDYPDGKYAIKAIAYDKDGNFKENIINVNVLNRLLKVIVPAETLYSNSEYMTVKGWIFLSDGNGKTLGIKKYINGEIFEFPTPDDYTEDNVIVNFVNVYVNEFPGFNSITGIIQTREINVAEEVTLHPTSTKFSTNVVGNAKATLYNIPDYDYYNYNYKSSRLSLDGSNGNVDIDIPFHNSVRFNAKLYKSPLHGLISIEEKDINNHTTKYKILENFKSNDVIDIDYKDLLLMTGSFNLAIPETSTQNYKYLSANRILGDNSTKLVLGSSTDKKKPIHFPEDVFAEFESYVNYTNNEKLYAFYKIGDILTSLNPLNVDSEIKNANVEDYNFTNTGDYDVSSLLFKSSSVSENDPNIKLYFDWNITSSKKANVTGKLPVLPSEIMNEHSFMIREKLTANRLSFTDYLGITYDEYYNAVNKGQLKLINEGYNHVSEIISLSNGRTALLHQPDLKDIDEIINQPYGL